MIVHQENERLTDVLNAARRTAREYRHGQYGSAHLLYALMEKRTGLPALLEAWSKDHEYIRDWAEMRLENYPSADHPVEFPSTDEHALRVSEEAEKVRLRLGLDLIDPFCMLVALITPGVAWSLPQLQTLPLTDQEAMGLISSRPPTAPQNHDYPTDFSGFQGVSENSSNIPYCNPLSDAFIQKGQLVVGREGEIRRMAEALHRRENTGILVLGDSGVGKSALLQGFAHYLKMGTDSDSDEWTLLQLNVIKLISGCAHNGEVESRLVKTLDKVRHLSMPILFIDDLHILLEDKGGGNHVAFNLSSCLSEGGIGIVAATTTESYTKKIESNEALLRKLEVVRIAEPGPAATLKCLEVHCLGLEKHHELRVAETAIQTAAKLSRRYFKDRRLPDSGINLLDRTLSAVSQSNTRSQEECQALQEELEQLEREFSIDPTHPKLMGELQWLDAQVQSRLSPVLLGQLSNPQNSENIREPGEFSAYLKSTLEELQELARTKRKGIGEVEVAAMVAHHTGIPLGKIQAKEQEKMLKLEDHLRKRVVGQDQAISALSDAIIEARSGLGAKGKPIGSFFFLGPTGTGKTELAKTLAEFLFNDEQSIIRFDMSEFKEEHSAALLYGAPPGYVGYEEGGLLVNQIRQKPYSIVLFDEIEKAHPSVYDIFLQIMDEGHVHDRLGKKGSFVDAIVIFTSNIGSDWISMQFRGGKIPSSSQLTEIMAQHFRPEFLGRLTEVVPFGPISESVVVKIFDIQLRKFQETLDDLGIELKVSDPARRHLAQSGYSDRYGARPIASVIRSKIRKPISRMLVQGVVKKGMELLLDMNEAQNLIWSTPDHDRGKEGKNEP